VDLPVPLAFPIKGSNYLYEEEISMAKNFRILTHRSSDSVHFKLIGDFDSVSADELFYAVKKNIMRAGRIFVHTNGLESIHTFDKTAFRNNLSTLVGSVVRLVFTGKNGAMIAPDGSRLL
jgi:hypothetical protein